MSNELDRGPFSSIVRSLGRPLSPWGGETLYVERVFDYLGSLDDALNITESDGQLVVEALVPGIPAEKLDVTLKGNVLRIKAKTEEKEEKKEGDKVVSRSKKTRKISYTTTLPTGIDSENILAEVENGILIIKAPITGEKAEAKKITVTAKAG